MDVTRNDLREFTYVIAEAKGENKPLSYYLSKYKERAYRAFAVVSIAAGMLSSCNPVNSSESSQRETNEKPTATQTLLSSSTLSVTPTNTSTPTQTFTPTNTPTRMSMSENPEVRGFSYTSGTCGVEQNNSCRTIEAKNALIDSYKVDGDEIVLEVTMRLNRKVFKETVRTKIFYWVQYRIPFNIVAESYITSEDYLENIFPIGRECNLGLAIEGQDEFPDELISNYINGYTDLSFNLIYLLCPVYETESSHSGEYN